jgi:hypothetical protein
MTTDMPLPGTRLKCTSNRDRPELVEGQEYVVVPEVALDKMPINYKRHQPDDFRLIAVGQGSRRVGIFPMGAFEVIT